MTSNAGTESNVDGHPIRIPPLPRMARNRTELRELVYRYCRENDGAAVG